MACRGPPVKCVEHCIVVGMRYIRDMLYFFLGFLVVKSLMMKVKSSSQRMSDSMLNTVRLTSRSWDIVVRRRFSVNFSLENDRSPLSESKNYILSAISTLENVSWSAY